MIERERPLEALVLKLVLVARVENVPEVANRVDDLGLGSLVGELAS